MRRLIYIGFTVTLFSHITMAQVADNTESKDSTNIYYQALVKYTSYLEKLNLPQGQVIFLEENSFVTDGLPSKLGGLEVQYLDIQELQKKAKKGEVELIRIVPLRFRNQEFFVNLITFGVTYRRKNFNFVNQGGVQAIFTYDDDIGKFVFKEIR